MLPLYNQLNPLGVILGRQSQIQSPIFFSTPVITGTVLTNEGTLGNSYNGIVAGATSSLGAIYFDGIDDYVTIPWKMERPFTVNFWIKRLNNLANHTILHGASITSAPRLRIPTTRTVLCELANNNSIVSTPRIINSTYCMVSLYMAVTNSLSKVYINSIIENVVPATPTGNPSPSTNTIIGAYRNLTGFFPGYLGNIRIWNAEVLQADITKIFAIERIKFGV